MGNRFSRGRDVEHNREINEKKRQRQLLLEKEEEEIRKADLKCSDETDSVDLLNVEAYRARALKRATTIDPLDERASRLVVEDYEYPFENLVFEGGGNKGLAYVGSVRCLEELGMMQKIKRVGGASAGAITAALVALGYSSEDILDFLSDNIEEIFLDHSCGYLSLLPNLLRRFGWNPGQKIHKWFGDKIKDQTKTGNPDLTFFELYKEKGMELCVVVTNLNQMRTEYCHPKTTPDMPIREALCMTMAIPGVFMARQWDNHGQKDTYVDGGVLCNYPIHCFDGWYLSMKKDDAFLLRLQSLNDLPRSWATKNRFEERNQKTVGFLLYDDTEMEVMRYSLEKRIGATFPLKPKKATQLYKQKQKEKEDKNKFEKEHSKVVRAVEAFMKVLHKHNLNDVEVIDKEELKNALEDTQQFSREQQELLFGKDVDVDTAFAILDKDGNGQVAFLELLQFIEERGIRMQTRIQGYGRIEVKSLVQFLSALQNSWCTNLKYVFVEDSDVDRTVGINTGHVGTSNYSLEEEDREFAVERGYNATRTFLAYYAVTHQSLVKKKTKPAANESNNAITGAIQEKGVIENGADSSQGAAADGLDDVDREDKGLLSKT